MAMDRSEFRKQAHRTADWICDYFENLESMPVKAKTLPGEIFQQIPDQAPEKPCSFDEIMADFEKVILPGITHWQHPKFMAYFPANSSPASILAEMMTAAMGAQCMSWQTSPAATELEEKLMIWLAGLLGLPEGFTGVIESGASLATFSSLLTARERASGGLGNKSGVGTFAHTFTMYCSEEAHSSVEKAVRMSGLGGDNLRKIPVDQECRIDTGKLKEALESDKKAGLKPLWMTAVMGSTGTAAVDPLPELADLCQKEGIWLHVDAAYAGPCMMLPEYAWLRKGLEGADSLVFNPHKWMFTNFDCSVYFVKDPQALKNTFEILPEYLKTREGDRVNNYRDWGPALGRRFRALKLWFVLRNFGAEAIREKMRFHITLAKMLADRVASHPDFELLSPVNFNLVCFRIKARDHENSDNLNKVLMENINATGSVYLTHTKVHGLMCLRLVTGQTDLKERHMDEVWNLLLEEAKALRRHSTQITPI